MVFIEFKSIFPCFDMKQQQKDFYLDFFIFALQPEFSVWSHTQCMVKTNIAYNKAAIGVHAKIDVAKPFQKTIVT